MSPTMQKETMIEEILDNVESIREGDPSNMYNCIFDLPEQIGEALDLGRGWKVQADDFSGIKNILVIGMGGSAIGGDLIRSLLASELLVPFQVCRNYTLPEYVDDESLVIVSSYSGNTEETLAALDDAIERKAMIAAVTTGGIVEEVAELNQIPWVKLPTGLQPRAAIGYSFVPLLVFLEKIGLARDVTPQIERVIEHLSSTRLNFIEDNPVKMNLAKQLAVKLYGKIPIVYSGPTLTDAVGLRWKGQLCENSKVLAFCNQFPEFNHNELVGWSELVEPIAEKLIVLMLRDIEDHIRVQHRINTVKDLIKKHLVEVVEVPSSGATRLQRMFSLIQLGDFVSYYLAVLNKVDPTPVQVIESLKMALAAKK